jgi:hypothetical protein
MGASDYVQKLALFVIGAAMAVLAWVQPCPLKGWGWFLPALGGPFLMLAAVAALIFPAPPDPDTFAGKQSGNRRPESVWGLVLEVSAVAAGMIHGGVWLYFNWR